MPRFFRNKRVVILAISFVVLVALIIFSLRENRELTWPERFAKDTVGLVQSAFHVPAQYVAGFFENVKDLKNTYEENKVLKARIDESAAVAAKVNGLEDEVKRLEAILKKKEGLHAFEPIVADVITRNPNGWYDVVRINVGKEDGIKKDMAVTTAQGLVGKVKSVGEFYSDVELLSGDSRTNRISAIARGPEGKDIFGTIEGYDEETQTLLFKRIPSNAPIEVGQEVVTSAMSDIFPKDLAIGTVEKVEPDEFGLTKIAYVKPVADFYDIRHVIVTKSKGVQE
ncbi:rod shape-determining protein MreC [Priestia taiwanensis]|uniref:Cell shape-determining protein MreC n=1 Tax=Priestia taiwanensis TaxID=1347902 RepID=A0A917AVJ5_9BACI|nr:rod shape-determining protein MreC [Priestia taiwanensis]MBM7363606.1 rod shape-determining protein MreC [Priestia taiwanensis]GGE75687.1 cell shape-determining protein MreC [Priestia taiwanensis]